MPRTLTFERDVIFNADLPTVLEVLLGTEDYPEYIDNVESAEVIYKRESESEVSFKAKVSVFPFEYSVKTTKISNNKIIFEQRKGFFSLLNGEWRLTESPGQVKGIYIVSVKLPLFAAGKIIEKAISFYFPNMIQNFKDEVERRFERTESLNLPNQ